MKGRQGGLDSRTIEEVGPQDSVNDLMWGESIEGVCFVREALMACNCSERRNGRRQWKHLVETHL